MTAGQKVGLAGLVDLRPERRAEGGCQGGVRLLVALAPEALERHLRHVARDEGAVAKLLRDRAVDDLEAEQADVDVLGVPPVPLEHHARAAVEAAALGDRVDGARSPEEREAPHRRLRHEIRAEQRPACAADAPRRGEGVVA